MPDVQLRITGPDRFCPDCGRWLVRVKEGGKFDLAALAGLQTESVVLDADEPLPEFVEALVISATCLICHPED
jgi:hypothetical protein